MTSRVDWSKFDPPENEGPLHKNLREARKLLALRIDRGAPAEMIKTAQLGLDNITAHILALDAARQAAIPTESVFSLMTPCVRRSALIALALFLAVAFAHVVIVGPSTQTHAGDPFPGFPQAPIMHPGAGYLLMQQGAGFAMPPDPKIEAKEQANAAKVLKQANSAYAKFQRSR